MKWFRLYKESEEENQTIPIEVSMRELKVIQNYLNKGKSLNDPSNKEAMNLVIRILNELVDNSQIENLDTYVSNFFFDNLGIQVELDPYGENSAIELAKNGLVSLTNCKRPELCQDGEFQDLVQGGFWNPDTGILEEGFMEVDDLNPVLAKMQVGNGIKSIQLKKEGNVAKLLLEFE